MGGSQLNTDYGDNLATFREELVRLSTLAQRRLQIETRWTDADALKTRTFAAELVAEKPDVIFASTTPAVAALKRITSSIPIVFANVSDPIGEKFVTSLNHPGANITGFARAEPTLGGKWLALLKEAVPGIQRATIMFNPETAPDAGNFFLDSFEATAKSVGVVPLSAPVHNNADIESAIANMHGPLDGLILMDDSFMAVKSRIVIAAAARVAAPTIFVSKSFVVGGGLMTYYADTSQQFRQAAGYVHRILQGENPAQLPVQTPTKYELAINLKTAGALGLDIPQALLAAAAEVIE